MFGVKNWPQGNPSIFYGKFSNIVQIHTVFILHHCIRSFKTGKEYDERLDRVMTNPDKSGLTDLSVRQGQEPCSIFEHIF